LLAGYAAAERIDFESGRYGRFKRAPKVFTEEGRHLDTAVFYVENNGAAGGFG
jgi:hypothetical protein